MKEVLVTGANGYVGARLSKFLSENGYAVTALCYPSVPSNEEWRNKLKHVIVGDVRNESVLDEIASCSIDTVIHLISLDHHQCTQFSFNDVLSVNVNPTGNLLEKLSKNGLRKFIYFSTFQVYGKVESSLITEEYKTSPGSIYGLTHLLSEQICNLYNSISDVDCLSVRLSNSYGSPVFNDNNCWWLVINELCKEAFLNHKIQLKSDGSPLRDFIHSSDLCMAIKLLIDKKEKRPSNIYNLSSGNTLSILELACKVQEVFLIRYKRKIDIILPNSEILDYPVSLSINNRFTVDNSRLCNLGFSVKTSIEVGINELFDYFEK